MPPISDIPRALKKALGTTMGGLLVIPLWQHGRFWPLVMPDGTHAVRGIYAIYKFSTKMVQPVPPPQFRLLTSAFQTYLALAFRGREGPVDWRANFSKKTCMKTVFGQKCCVCR